MKGSGEDDKEAKVSALHSSMPESEREGYSRLSAQYHFMDQRQSLGWLGRLFGSHTAAPTNIAGAVILLSFLFVGASLFAPSNADLIEARKLAFAVISSAMAFIFGAASKK